VGQVVLIRPWTDARAGGGCCSGEVRDGVAPGVSARPHRHDEADVVGAAYRLLRHERPDLDVQVVGAGNTLWLVPTVFRPVRRREGVVAALGAALRANRAGAVIVDGEVVGDIEDLGPEGVLRSCRPVFTSAEPDWPHGSGTTGRGAGRSGRGR
jgi:hypothetical protein